jgi:hypothetical protein
VYDNNIINEHMGWKRIGFSKWPINAHLTRAILNDFASGLSRTCGNYTRTLLWIYQPKSIQVIPCFEFNEARELSLNSMYCTYQKDAVNNNFKLIYMLIIDY